MLAKENYDIPQVGSASFQNECSNFPRTGIRLNRLAARWRKVRNTILDWKKIHRAHPSLFLENVMFCLSVYWIILKTASKKCKTYTTFSFRIRFECCVLV